MWRRHGRLRASASGMRRVLRRTSSSARDGGHTHRGSDARDQRRVARPPGFRNRARASRQVPTASARCGACQPGRPGSATPDVVTTTVSWLRGCYVSRAFNIRAYPVLSVNGQRDGSCACRGSRPFPGLAPWPAPGRRRPRQPFAQGVRFRCKPRGQRGTGEREWTANRGGLRLLVTQLDGQGRYARSRVRQGLGGGLARLSHLAARALRQRTTKSVGRSEWLESGMSADVGGDERTGDGL